MPLKPQFLPVGSIVEYNGAPCIVQSISNNIITTVGNSAHISEFNGIPLTPEILTEWCGFANSKEYDKYYIFGKDIAISMADDKIRVIKGNFVCQLVIAEIEYLHELQLLFLGFKQVLTVKIK